MVRVWYCQRDGSLRSGKEINRCAHWRMFHPNCGWLRLISEDTSLRGVVKSVHGINGSWELVLHSETPANLLHEYLLIPALVPAKAE